MPWSRSYGIINSITCKHLSTVAGVVVNCRKVTEFQCVWLVFRWLSRRYCCWWYSHVSSQHKPSYFTKWFCIRL